jgi:hypothetical protein
LSTACSAARRSDAPGSGSMRDPQQAAIRFDGRITASVSSWCHAD